MNQIMENTIQKDTMNSQIENLKVAELTGKNMALEELNEKLSKERILMMQYIDKLEKNNNQKLISTMKELENENVDLLNQNKTLL